MRKEEKTLFHDKSPSVEKSNPDVPLDLLLEKNLTQKLHQTARRQEIPLEKVILDILTERFTKGE